MVVMHMRKRPHCTIDLRDNSRHKTGMVSAVPLWQSSGPRSTPCTGRFHFPEHEDDCMEAYPLRAYLDSWSWNYIVLYTTKYSMGDQHYWTVAIILAICDIFTVMVASQA